METMKHQYCKGNSFSNLFISSLFCCLVSLRTVKKTGKRSKYRCVKPKVSVFSIKESLRSSGQPTSFSYKALLRKNRDRREECKSKEKRLISFALIILLLHCQLQAARLGEVNSPLVWAPAAVKILLALPPAQRPLGYVLVSIPALAAVAG